MDYDTASLVLRQEISLLQEGIGPADHGVIGSRSAEDWQIIAHAARVVGRKNITDRNLNEYLDILEQEK
jgi:hypothetical protein